MNINEIKTGFSEYLNNLNETQNKNYQNVDSNESIFNYTDEFETYVSDELNINTDEVAIDINTINELEIQNGKLIDPNEGVGENDESLIIQLTNELLDIEEVMDSVDKDNNGEVSDSELTDFLNDVSKEEKDDAKLSISKFMSFLKNIASNQEKQIETQEKMSDISSEATQSDIDNSSPNYAGKSESERQAAQSTGGSSSNYDSNNVSSSSGAPESSNNRSSGSSSNAEKTGSLAGKENCDLNNKLVSTAFQYNGYHESGSTKFFQGSTCQGCDDASTPWCAAFVQYCVRESGVDTPEWFKNAGNSAACKDYYDAASAAGALVTDITQAKAGDLILFGEGGSQHIGIVAQDYSEAGALYTIEGNHGDEVQIVDRTDCDNIAGIAQMGL